MRGLVLLLFITSFSNSIKSQETWSLQRCIDYAYQNSVVIKQSELNLEMSKAGALQSKASALPNLNVNASHGYNWGQTIDFFTNTFATERIRQNSFSLSSSVTLFNGFQTINTIKQNDLDVSARLEDLNKIKNDIALNVANAYLNVLFNEEFVNISKSNLESSAQQVDRISKLVNAGAAPKGSLYDIEAQLAADEASLITSENNLRLSYLALTQLLQMGYSEASTFRIAKPDLDDIELTSLVSDSRTVVDAAMRNFPEIKSAEVDVLGAQKGLTIARGANSPRLTASFSYGSGYSGATNTVLDSALVPGFPIGTVDGTGELVTTFSQLVPNNTETTPFFDQLDNNQNRSLFLNLSIPIFNGLSTKTNIQRAEIGVKNAQYQLENTKNTLEQSVERAYVDAKAAYRSFQASERSVRASEEAFSYATIQYEEGVINAVDFTAVRVRLDNARANMVRSKYDYIFKTKVVDFYLGKAITLGE